MSVAYDIYTPDGTKRRLIESRQNGRLEIRSMNDGSIEVVGVHTSNAVRGRNGETLRPASRREEVLGTYPAGTRVEQIAW